MRKTTRRLTFVLATLSLGALLFYGGMNWAARFGADRAGLSPSARNSIQHAYAAAETYTWLRRFGASQAWALRTTVYLGYLNEWAETWVKWPRDSTAESYKDLRNNMLGAAAMQAKERCSGLGSLSDRLHLISSLSAKQILLWKSSDPRVGTFPEPLNVAVAISRFEADWTNIEIDAEAAVRALGC